MATTQEIMAAAQELGKLIAQHEASQKFEQVAKKLKDDVEAQRLMNDFNRQMTTMSEKESQGQPVEVEDKRRLQDLQQQVIQHPLLSELQMVQMDYLDLMRRVDDVLHGTTGPDMPGPDHS